jgi:cyclopropane-fatty-acyl-phospholipid synthase
MSLIPASYIENSWRKALGALEHGELVFTAPNGEVTLARGSNPGPKARFHIRDWDVLRRIMARGDIGLGEEYIAGSWDTDSVENLVSLFLLNLDHFSNFSDGNFLNRAGFVIHNALVRRNSVAGSARNIQDHYDVGNDFYSLWLDKSMTYSSALYNGAEELYRAQHNKYERMLSKFCIAKTIRDRLWLGRVCGTRRGRQPQCHRADQLAGPAQIRHRSSQRRRRHQARGLSLQQGQVRQYRLH